MSKKLPPWIQINPDCNPTLKALVEQVFVESHDCKISDGSVCEDCCEHGDTDDHSCLDCGKEMMEDRMAAAFDRAKASRQDG